MRETPACVSRLRRNLRSLQVLVQQLARSRRRRTSGESQVRLMPSAQPDRIDFLTHVAASLACWSATSRTTMVRWLNHFSTGAERPRPRAWKRFIAKRLADVRLGDDQPVDVELVVVLGIGDRRLQHLLHRRRRCGAWRRSARASARSALQAADQLGDEVQLARPSCGGCARRPAPRSPPACADASACPWLQSSSSPSCRPRGRGRCASARTRRTCGRPCSRSPAPAGTCGRCRRRRSGRRTAAGSSSGATRS